MADNVFKVGDKVRFTDKNIELTYYEKRWMDAGLIYEVVALEDGAIIIHLTPLMDGKYSAHYFEPSGER